MLPYHKEPYIPERFIRSVALHLVKNLLYPHINPPLFLAIQGPPGNGKTWLIDVLLHSMDVKPFRISGGQLESQEAGGPSKLIRKTYLNAGTAIDERECNAAAIIINDIDTGLGNFGDLVQYTVNRQTASGELMHLADFPNEVEGRKTKRIPIIMTGNDFTKLYQPLTRTGRMTTFDWIPTKEEKKEILLRMFPELNERDCFTLIDKFPEQPVVFFSQMRSRVTDDKIWENFYPYYKSIFKRDITSIRTDIFLEIEINNLIKIGYKIEDEIGKTRNYLA